jgi:beta-1,4-mannosyl-glycoprotein beta-1,4-N-acetylglucosaminyltransferase
MSRPGQMLPLAYDDTTSSQGRSSNGSGSSPFIRTYSIIRRRPFRYLISTLFALVLLINHTALGTLRRDFIYLIRPLWDSPPRPFEVIPHYPPPISGKPAWCQLHNWEPRAPGSRPIVVDAVQISTELDMMEIRMREYAPFVSVFIVVEAGFTHSAIRELR